MVSANELQAAAEAILFAAGEPLELSRLAQALEIEEESAEQVLLNLAASLDERGSGICLLKLGTKYQLSSRTEFAPQIRNVLEIKRNAPLSQAAFEVLAVIAYNQPVTKSFVEQVRGVDSSSTVTKLLEKGLIEEAGRLDLPGKPVAFQVTDNFLRVFGLGSLRDLPPLHDEEGMDAAPPEQQPEDAAEQLEWE